MKRVLKYQLPPAILVIVIYFLTAIPNVLLTAKTPLGVVKIVHAILYFILCWLVWRALYRQTTFPMMRSRALPGAFIFCVIYGLLNEYHHTVVPGRDSDFFDVVAGTGGALLFIALASLVHQHHDDNEENPDS